MNELQNGRVVGGGRRPRSSDRSGFSHPVLWARSNVAFVTSRQSRVGSGAQGFQRQCLQPKGTVYIGGIDMESDFVRQPVTPAIDDSSGVVVNTDQSYATIEAEATRPE